jgi:hypothetical protein
MMTKSDSIGQIAAALAQAQGEIENATKGSVNPHFKSKYADLAEILSTVRPVFSKFDLSFCQMPSFADGKATVETILMHKSGEWLASSLSAPVGAKQDAQQVGACVTYLRRYSMAAIAGIAQEDDDGNAVSQPKTPQKTPLTDDRMAGAVQAIADGKITLEAIQQKHTLTAAQLAALQGQA